MRKVVLLCVVLVCTLSDAKTELGELHGAAFRIDIPENWNHRLVVYCHGYSTTQVTYKNDKLNPVLSVFTEAGYAVAQSGYSKPGWAVEQAVTEVEALRKYFGEKYGAPEKTFITGHSMGGFLTVELIERFPTTYNGGLALCGPLVEAPDLLKRAFDFAVVFDYYFPDVLPSPVKVPSDYTGTEQKQKDVLRLLQANPAKAQAIKAFAKVKKDEELAADAVFIAYILKDLEKRSGGNPFSNRDMIYTGTPDDNGLNDGVKRYDASASLEYLKRNYTFTGKLARPVLAIHTTYDPLVPAEVPDHYALLAAEAGSANLFVQQYVEHDGHCNISPDETGAGFHELLAWTERHVKPQGGRLSVKKLPKTQ